MNNFLETILMGLVVYRITAMINFERLPLALGERLRAMVGITNDAGAVIANNEFAHLIACFYCLSVWVALPCAIFFSPAWLLYTFIYSTIAIIVYEVTS